jgi:aspartate--ammonia ligase
MGLGAGHHDGGSQPRLHEGRRQAHLEGDPRGGGGGAGAISGRKQRETRILQDVSPAVFIIGIGWPLEDGYPHEMRAADYDDWVTETVQKNGKTMHGLNGDILVWNPVTRRRHELTSMGVRVTKETLKVQLAMSGQEDFLELPYHQAILNDEIPLSIGGGIGQSRTFMYLLRTAHLGEVSVTVWPRQLKEICAARNIHVLE